jgi:hypothetical protein
MRVHKQHPVSLPSGNMPLTQEHSTPMHRFEMRFLSHMFFFRYGRLQATKFRVAWRQGGGTMMQQGGFGYVFFGTYDARPNPNAKYVIPVRVDCMDGASCLLSALKEKKQILTTSFFSIHDSLNGSPRRNRVCS